MTRKESKEKRISDIIQAAVEEFVEKGYEGASMQSIAQRAGLTKGGLYHHFSGKDEVLLAANIHFMKPIQDMMKKARADHSPQEGLRSFIRNYLEYWGTHPRELVFTFLSLVKMLSCRDMWPLIEDYTMQMSEFFAFMFTRGIETGEFRPHEARSRAIALFSALDGVTAYMVMDSTFTPTKTAEAMEAVFTDDLMINPISQKE